jgi:hypothetical protein
LVGNALGMCPFGRPKRILEDNIKIDLKGKGCENGIWMELAQG